MNKNILISVASGAIIVLLIFWLVIRGKDSEIKILNEIVKSSNYETSLCRSDKTNLMKSISSQNAQIEKLRLESAEATQKLNEQKIKIAEKWNKKTQQLYTKNATCEEQLKELDELDKSFFKERTK